MTTFDMVSKYYRWFNVSSKPLKDHSVLEVFETCANINNIDQIFPDFANKHVFNYDDDDENLTIKVYSVIKPSMGPEFILNQLLSLGRFFAERKLLLNDTLRGFSRNSSLIAEEDDPKYLQNYSNQVMNIFPKSSLCFFQMVNA